MCYQPRENQEIDFDQEMAGAFGRKLRKGFKKIGTVVKKAHTAPLKAIHKVTHGKRSPIRKLEEKLQGVVGKALPFTKPFIQAHNKVSNVTYGAMEKTGIIGKGDTKRIGVSDARSGSPQGAAARLAATVATGSNQVLPAEMQALRKNRKFRQQALQHLARHAASGNATANTAIRVLANR